MDWNVRVEERVPSGVPVAGYLARYLTGEPISDRRLVSVSADEVVFEYRDFRDDTTRPVRLTPDEFLDRWFEHVPRKALRPARYGGLYANCHTSTPARLCADQFAEAAAAEPPVNAIELEICPVCRSLLSERDTRPRPPARPIIPRPIPAARSRPPQ